MASDELVLYMNDHLSGAAAALSLIDRLIDGSQSAEDRRLLEALKAEIEEDASTVERLIHELGGERSSVRQAGGWISEKLAALKLRFDDPAGARLSRFEALEMLALGILGKRALWRVLRSANLPQLRSLDLEALEGRAQRQHDLVDDERLVLGRRLFAPAGNEAPAVDR